MPYLLFADRVRRGSRALAAVFREAPRGIRDGWRNARSVRSADALTRPLARGGALRLVVRSPLIPFVDPLPLPGGCRHRSTGAGWWLTSARRSTSSVASTLLLLRRIVRVLCPGCAREPMPRRHCVGGLVARQRGAAPLLSGRVCPRISWRKSWSLLGVFADAERGHTLPVPAHVAIVSRSPDPRR